MAETYKKINKDMLEITNTNIYQRERQHFEEEKKMAEWDIIEAKKRIAEMDIKLAVLNDISKEILN